MDLNDPYVWRNTFFVQMEAGLMETVRSLNRSWIYDTYFSFYRAIHPGEKSGAKCRGGNVRIPIKHANVHSCRCCFYRAAFLSRWSLGSCRVIPLSHRAGATLHHTSTRGPEHCWSQTDWTSGHPSDIFRIQHTTDCERRNFQKLLIRPKTLTVLFK